MRIRPLLVLILPVWLATASSAAAQDQSSESLAATPSVNFADFSGRGTWYTDVSDQGRAQRYRDLRAGGTLEFFRFANATDVRSFNIQADHLGFRDQRFSGEANRYGRFKVWFEYNQIPLYFSQETQTLFTTPESNPFALRMSDAIQTSVQAATNKTAALSVAAATQAQQFDLRLRRSIADFKTTISANRYLDVNVSVRSTAKTGEQPWAGTFGFSDAVELPGPVQTRTTDVGLGVEWANRRGSARIGYDGSFFRNDIQTLVWDNPQRVTDSPTLGPLQGRMTLWPNSDLNAATASGLLNLPARSRATAYVSIGNWTQDTPLIPFTVNSALPVIALDRTTSDAKARVTSMNYSFNSRPVDTVTLTLRYRSYDFDNRTPVFHVINTVAYDTTVSPFAEGGTSPYSLDRKTFDAELSYTPMRFTAFRAAYTREAIDQTFRFFDSTTENTVRLSADATGVSWLMLRAVYEHGKRVGSGFDEQALDDIGEQVSLRQFDISDRNTNRVSVLAQVTPVSAFSVNGSVSAGNEDRPGTVFGLRSNDNVSYSIGADYVPRESVSMGAQYTWEKYKTLQASRQANPGPQFDDPTRDWTTDGDDRAHTFTASMDLLKIARNTDVRLAYDFSHAESLYVYGLPPNTTLAAPVQLPPVVNELQRATAEVRYRFSRRFGAGIVYWYDKYTVNDFASGAQTLTGISQPSLLTIGYLTLPYTANTLSGRFTYFW
jgi:MtrB/PioB family decaheme-associated outer membrane protein